MLRFSSLFFFFSLLLSISLSSSCIDATPTSPPLNITRVIQTLNGPVQGIYSQGIQQFLGIPFASPPVSDLL
jgi:hypothetical protein